MSPLPASFAGAPVVLAVNRVGFLGGVERVVVRCGLAAQAYGFHTIVACPLPGELGIEAERNGIEAIKLQIDRSKASRSPVALMRRYAALRRGRRELATIAERRCVQLLHTHHPIGALYALQAARKLHLPLVLHVHETFPVHALYRGIARHVIPSCSTIICVSQRSREMMLALGAPENRLQVIYNAVDPGFLDAGSPVPEMLLPGPHIGLFGVLEPRKGQDVFIAAGRRLADRFPTARFWIIGDLSFAENASYVTSLEQAIAMAGLKERIMLTGHRRDVRQWMRGMDVIVLASRDRESLPTVLIEAAMLGRPLVATDVGGVREIIEHGRTGLVVPAGEPEVLAAAIARLLGPEASAFGAAARADAIQRFSFDHFGVAIAGLYRSLLQPSLVRAA